MELDQFGRREPDAQKFRRILDADRAIDALCHGAEKADQVGRRGGWPRRLQDQPGSARAPGKAGAVDHVGEIAVGDRDGDGEAAADIRHDPFDHLAAFGEAELGDFGAEAEHGDA